MKLKERNLASLPPSQRRWSSSRGECDLPSDRHGAGFLSKQNSNSKQSRSLAAELLKTLLPVSMILLLASCSSHKHLTYSYITTASAPVRVVNKNAQAQLAEAANSVGHSLQQMDAIQLATHPKAKLTQPLNPAIIGMAQQTSLDWTGPVEPLLDKIAHASHYKLRVLGKKPPIPVIVAITAHDVPLADILRNATFQAKDKANITLYPATKTIELRYYSS